MSRFTESHLQLVLIDAPDGRPELKGGRCTWRLAAPICYDVGAEGSGETITVPAGATTDFASVPRLAWTLFPPDGPWLKAAVVHDLLYRTRGLENRLDLRTRSVPYTRAEADSVFREAMGVLGVSAWRRTIIWSAVRLGGSSSWGS